VVNDSQCLSPDHDEIFVSTDLNIDECRRQRPYTLREYVGRYLWALLSPCYRFSPRTWFGWRRFLLRQFGAKVGRNVHVYPSARIYIPWNIELGDDSSIGEWALIYNLGPVRIGAQSTISHRAHLCAGTHDYINPSLPLRRCAIDIGPKAWVAANAFIGPNVNIGEGAVVGASSVVVRDVAPWRVVAGNPAKTIKVRELK